MNSCSRCCRVFLGNVTIHFSARFCWDIGTREKCKACSRTSLFVMHKVNSCSLGTTSFTISLFVAFDGRHLSNSCISENSEINLKIVGTSLQQFRKSKNEKI